MSSGVVVGCVGRAVERNVLNAAGANYFVYRFFGSFCVWQEPMDNEH